jgi:hypothetical protein
MALGVNPGARTWSRYKAQFLANVNDYVKQLPKLRVISQQDHDRVLADLEGTQEALRDAESVIRTQETKIRALVAAKSAEEITEIMLPEGERERFDVLVKKISQALSKLPSVMRDAMWFEFVNREMPWPNSFDGKADADDAYNEGWLRDGPDDGLVPNDDFDEVRAASEALAQLNSFLSRSDLSEAFDKWFRAEYHASPDLRLKRVWDQLF